MFTRRKLCVRVLQSRRRAWTFHGSKLRVSIWADHVKLAAYMALLNVSRVAGPRSGWRLRTKHEDNFVRREKPLRNTSLRQRRKHGHNRLTTEKARYDIMRHPLQDPNRKESPRNSVYPSAVCPLSLVNIVHATSRIFAKNLNRFRLACSARFTDRPRETGCTWFSTG